MAQRWEARWYIGNFRVPKIDSSIFLFSTLVLGVSKDMVEGDWGTAIAGFYLDLLCFSWHRSNYCNHNNTLRIQPQVSPWIKRYAPEISR
jgi:hypothetical protein